MQRRHANDKVVEDDAEKEGDKYFIVSPVPYRVSCFLSFVSFCFMIFTIYIRIWHLNLNNNKENKI